MCSLDIIIIHNVLYMYMCYRYSVLLYFYAAMHVRVNVTLCCHTCRLWIYRWTIRHAPLSMQCCSIDWSVMRSQMAPLARESGIYMYTVCTHTCTCTVYMYMHTHKQTHIHTLLHTNTANLHTHTHTHTHTAAFNNITLVAGHT